MNIFHLRLLTLICTFAIVLTSVFVAHSKPENKLTATDIIAKHLDSIGPPDARVRTRGTRIKGTCELVVKLGGNGVSQGQVLMASQGNQNLINMTFDSGEPATGFAFDGNKTIVTQFRPGRHTPIEQFFAEYEDLIKDGLIGGVLSESWALLKTQEKNGRLEYAGLKKIDGVQLHAVKYTPRKNSELKITLLFDPETFRHLGTEYERTIYSTEQTRISQGQAGTLPSASDARTPAQRLTAHETFSDFKTENGLNLPHTYRFELSVQSPSRPMLVDWTFNLVDFKFNVPLDANQFNFRNDGRN